MVKIMNKEDYLRKANEALMSKKTNQAIEYFQAVLEEDSDNEKAHLGLSKLYIDKGNLSKAKRHLFRVLSNNPDHEDALNQIKKLIGTGASNQSKETIGRQSSNIEEIFQRKARERLVETVNGVTFEMVYVEGGTFMMGATQERLGYASPDEYPAHKVTLSSYYIGQTEVTQALWEAVMGDNPSQYKGDDLPVMDVNWYDCQEFISKLNTLTGRTFRLPTEAEWEYAARGGNKSCGYKYSGSDNYEDVAWDDFIQPHSEGTKSPNVLVIHNACHDSNYNMQDLYFHSVETKLPNELGIYDMSGRCFEWCWDWYGRYRNSPQSAPQGRPSGKERVCRGYHVSYRIGRDPSDSYGDDISLRLAL